MSKFASLEYRILSKKMWSYTFPYLAAVCGNACDRKKLTLFKFLKAMQRIRKSGFTMIIKYITYSMKIIMIAKQLFES